ncbi:MAG: MurR/RpiR family transcriptional regulator [Clostridia bacterium]|nr:MurR/RpiR family transcriptional regulator [Clostridia bacterium]
MKSTLISRIEESYTSMSKSHKVIADYILENYEIAAYLTAARLGEETGISVSTVVRFASTMGFEGYPEFQQALRETIKGKLTTPQRIEVSLSQISNDEIIDRVLTKDIDMIKDSLANISREDFKKATETINSAKKIYIIGVRSSASLASFMYFYFKMIFTNVRLISSNSESEMFEEIIKISPDDVCIALSFPRYSKQVYNVLSFARDKGAKIVAITDNENAPIASLADNVLIAKSEMTSFMDSLVAPLSIINALMLSVARQRSDEVKQAFVDLEKVWDQYEVYEKLEESEN